MRKNLDPIEERKIAQEYLDEVFHGAKVFYIQHENAIKIGEYKNAAFQLHQACEHAYKTVLLIFGNECPQEHHLDILVDLAIDYCPELGDILPNKTKEQKKLFELLDYAYIGARYDNQCKITKEQLIQIGLCVKKLHEVTEKCCKNKIDSFTI